MTDVISDQQNSQLPVLNVQHFTKKYGNGVAVNDVLTLDCVAWGYLKRFYRGL